MSKQATESTLCKINRLLQIDDSYKAPERIMSIISDAKTAKDVFLKFLPEFDYNLNLEWFHDYFQDEHADRRNLKQDFTPLSISKLIARINGDDPQYGVIYEPSAGTGSTIIAHWAMETRKNKFPWDYFPSNYLYLCEEISDKTVPFLLFNLLIRGMNAVVIHGNSLTREAKDAYFCYNKRDEFMSFSELMKFPHKESVEKTFSITFDEMRRTQSRSEEGGNQ